MLNVLIVDDDKLTRKGLIASMPWQQYQMEVVGEAANGVEALAFLQDHDADLVLTDLEMPLMSGMEFIRRAKELRPHLFFVVLTIHSDFEYIQEALRLGAIDYIAKVQLDRENFSVLLERIHGRIQQSVQQRSALQQDWGRRVCHMDAVHAMLTLQEEDNAAAVFEEAGLTAYHGGDGVWLCLQPVADTQPFALLLDSGWMLLHIQGVLGMTLAAIARLLAQYRRDRLFYEYNPDEPALDVGVRQLQERRAAASDERFQQIKRQWLSLNWINHPEDFDRLRLELLEARLTPPRLLHLILAIENAWNASYSDSLNQTVHAPPSFHSWRQVEQWLLQIRRQAQMLQDSSRFTPEVTRGILTARQIIEQNFHQPLHSEEVARQVGMSRSYFSACFHEIVGCSFSEYLRNVRIGKAKEYLERTNFPMQTIAERIGYLDEKYFSRIFKRTTNLLPSEYRRFHRRG